MNKNTLFKNILINKDKISQFGVKRLGLFGLFGLFVRDEQNKGSDVDIMVEFSYGKKNIDNFMNLVFFLEDTLKRKVDLLTKEALSPSMRKYVLSEVQFIEISN
ncbi:MAG: nucleotidyltransferase domain-containing protein [Candidatus Schekmanbacteria bacterium]|nr:nucleotidyltransferase domain-containing protein [Candidatus Schekmanbacteria bacterium]